MGVEINRTATDKSPHLPLLPDGQLVKPCKKAFLS